MRKLLYGGIGIFEFCWNKVDVNICVSLWIFRPILSSSHARLATPEVADLAWRPRGVKSCWRENLNYNALNKFGKIVFLSWRHILRSVNLNIYPEVLNWKTFTQLNIVFHHNNRPTQLEIVKKINLIIWNIYVLILSTITKQTQNNCIIFIQRRPNVFDVGSTLYKFYTNLFLFAGKLPSKAITAYFSSIHLLPLQCSLVCISYVLTTVLFLQWWAGREKESGIPEQRAGSPRERHGQHGAVRPHGSLQVQRGRILHRPVRRQQQSQEKARGAQRHVSLRTGHTGLISTVIITATS